MYNYKIIHIVEEHLYSYYSIENENQTFEDSNSLTKKNKLLGFFLARAGVFPIKRDNADMKAIKRAVKMLKNKEIVAILYQKGIFNLKDSVITIANHLGISKNTVYMHIRNMNK